MGILCATDFSDVASRSVAVAAQWARRLSQPLTLVHVISPPTMPHEIAAGLGSFTDAIRHGAQQELTRAADELRATGLRVETCVLAGPAEAALGELAGETRAHLLVLGTHGRKGASRFFLGSVAERVIKTAPCPVLVVPAQAVAGLLTEPASNRPLKIVAGLDRSRASQAAVAWLASLRAHVPCDVEFVHVYWAPREHARLGVEGPFDELSDDPEVLEVLRRELEGLIRDLPGQGSVTLRIHSHWGDGPDPLAHEAAGEDADLLLVGTSRRHPFLAGSTALATVRAASVPVLCVPVLDEGKTESAARADSVEPIRRVLCATDLSPLANQAVPTAYRLLRSPGSTVELCTVVDPPREGLSPEQRRSLEHDLRRLVPADAQRRGIRTRVHVIESPTPATAILQTIERLGVGLAVLGTHGRSGLTRVVLGSVADAVVREATCPVVIVRAPAQ